VGMCSRACVRGHVFVVLFSFKRKKEKRRLQVGMCSWVRLGGWVDVGWCG